MEILRPLRNRHQLPRLALQDPPSDPPVLLMFESVLARDESHHAAFGMNVFTVALEAAIRAVRIDRPLLVTLYR